VKFLIATADDLGLHRGMNEGAERAHRHGILTACSVVANGRELAHAVEVLRDLPGLEVGIHLTFVEERPLSDKVSSLVDSSGRFHKSYREFVARYATGSIDLEQLERELRAQIEKVLSTGLTPTHLNSHQHLHVLPGVLDIVSRLAQEFRIGYLRVPLDRGGRGRPMAMRFLAALARRARWRLGGNARAIGIAEAGHLSGAKLVRLLDHVVGVTELVAHPGIGTPEISASYDWGYAWDEETAGLCDPAVAEAIRQQGILLITPSQAVRIMSSQQSAAVQ
jgi:predicted glycoside hydrolase/deacetylase ChbG (UPF0249 family)